MDRDASEVGERELRLELSADDVVGDFVGVLHGLRRRVRRQALRRLLLEEARSLHPVRTALEREEPILDVWSEAFEHVGIERDEIAHRVALLGPKDLVGVRDADAGDRLRSASPRHETPRLECQTDFLRDFFGGFTSFGFSSIWRKSAGGSPSAAFFMLPPSSRAISTSSRSETTDRG